jgi:hypothetical protein
VKIGHQNEEHQGRAFHPLPVLETLGVPSQTATASYRSQRHCHILAAVNVFALMLTSLVVTAAGLSRRASLAAAKVPIAGLTGP